MTRPRRGTPVTIVTPKWKVGQLARMVRGRAERGWLTKEEASRIIRDGKKQMVYTPPKRARRGKS